MNAVHDISPLFAGPDPYESALAQRIIEHTETPEAIRIFAAESGPVSDYFYWFTLGTLWVSYSGFYPLADWRRLFRSKRANCRASLMKPSEFAAFKSLPRMLRCFRVHRPGEVDWISYTLDINTAAKFAARRGVREVVEYTIPRREALALFLRRGEYEVLCLERWAAKKVRTLPVVTRPSVVSTAKNTNSPVDAPAGKGV